MSRLNTEKYSSLNESIASVQNPEAALQEALEYSAALETVILSLCEELDLDPQELVEDVMTQERERELSKKMKEANKKTEAKRKQSYAGFDKAYKRSQALGKRYEKEGSSHKVFGKGGKLIKGIKTSPRKDARDISGSGHGRWSDQR